MEGFLDSSVVGIFGNQVVAGTDSGGVGIDDKDWTIEGVKQNRVGGFGADTFDGKKLLAQIGGADIFEIFKTAGVVVEKPVEEIF